MSSTHLHFCHFWVLCSPAQYKQIIQQGFQQVCDGEAGFHWIVNGAEQIDSSMVYGIIWDYFRKELEASCERVHLIENPLAKEWVVFQLPEGSPKLVVNKHLLSQIYSGVGEVVVLGRGANQLQAILQAHQRCTER